MRLLWTALLLGVALPAQAHYRQPVLRLVPDKDLPIAGISKTFEDSGRGDTARAVANMTAPASFSANSGVSTSMSVSITVSSARGGTAQARLVLEWSSGIAMLSTPDSLKGPTEPIVSTAEVVVPKGGTATLNLAAGVQFIPLANWDEENRCITYRVSPGAGGWDSSVAGLGSPEYHALMHTYSEGRVGLGGGYELDVSMGGASIHEHLSYSYEGKAEYYDESAAVAVAPAPPSPAPPRPKTDDSAYREQADEMDRLLKLYDRMSRMERRLAQAGTELRLQGLAASDLRKRIRALEEAIADDALYAAEREEAREKLPQLRAQLASILDAQDKLITQVSLEYKELALQAGVALDAAVSSDMKDKLEAIKATLDAKHEVLPLQLYLASGQREKFQQVSRDLIARKVQLDVVYRLRAADYIENGDPRSALYALRKALAVNSQDQSSQAMMRGIEVGYLRAIAAKTLGDAAEVRQKFEEAVSAHGEAGGINYLKDLLTTGITSSVSAIGGKPESLADLAVTAADEAAVEHAGLEIIIRLRQKGFTLGRIQKMTNEELVKALQTHYHADVADADAFRMRRSMAMAFRNADVKRLLAPTKEQFDADRGTSYFATDAFDPTWQDYIGDAASVANVAMTFAPSAIVSSGGKLVTVRLMKAEELAQARNLSEAFASGLKLEEMARRMGQTQAGQAVLQELLRFEESTGFVSKMLAQTLIQEGLIQAGGRLGGRPGEIAAEILAAFGTGDLEGAARFLKRCGVKSEQVDSLTRRLARSLADAEKARVPSQPYLQKAEKALAEMQSGAVSSKTAQELRAAAKDMEGRAQTTLKLAGDAGDSTLALEAHKQDVLADTLKAGAEGKAARTKRSLEYVRKLEKDAADNAQAITNDLTIAKRVKERLAAGELPTTLPARPAVQAPRTKPASGSSRAAQAEDAFLRRNYKLARQRFDAALELGKDLAPEEIERIQGRIKLIGEVEQVARERAARRSVASNRAISQPFSAEEAAHLEAIPWSQTKPVVYASGEASFTKPRKMYNSKGEPIAIFKPMSLEGGMDLDGEVAAYEFGKLLGVDVPAVTRIKVRGPAGEEIEGVAIRHIDGDNFINAGEAQFLYAKREIAQDKAFSAFIGDHDRHMGNYYSTVDGRVLSIDHGMADLAEVQAQGLSHNEFEAFIRHKMETRVTGVGQIHPEIGGLERNIVLQDMADMVGKIEGLSDEQITAVLKRVHGGGADAEQKIARALAALKVRQQQLRGMMEQHFPPLPNPISGDTRVGAPARSAPVKPVPAPAKTKPMADLPPQLLSVGLAA